MCYYYHISTYVVDNEDIQYSNDCVDRFPSKSKEEVSKYFLKGNN